MASAQALDLAAKRKVLLYLLIAQYPEAVNYRNRPPCPSHYFLRLKIQILLMGHRKYQSSDALNRRRKVILNADIYQILLVMEKK